MSCCVSDSFQDAVTGEGVGPTDIALSDPLRTKEQAGLFAQPAEHAITGHL